MQTTKPKDYIELLEVFSIGLTIGLLDKSEVVKWADNIITNDSEPDYFIIELSLCGHKNINDMISLINEFVGQDKPRVSVRVILGLLYKQYLARQITLKTVVNTLYRFAWDVNLTEEEKNFMYGLDDYYDCAVDGTYGTVEGVEKETLRLLEIYKDFQIDNLADWNKINATIDTKIQHLTDAIRQEQAAHIKPQDTKKWWQLW